jgi:hypothetical protein
MYRRRHSEPRSPACRLGDRFWIWHQYGTNRLAVGKSPTGTKERARQESNLDLGFRRPS